MMNNDFEPEDRTKLSRGDKWALWVFGICIAAWLAVLAYVIEYVR